jgi:hypothetical protein
MLAAACSRSPATPTDPSALPATLTMVPGDTRSFPEAEVTLTLVPTAQPQCGPADLCLPWPNALIQTQGPAGTVPIVLAPNIDGMRVGHGNGVVITLLSLVEDQRAQHWVAKIRVEEEPRLPFD